MLYVTWCSLTPSVIAFWCVWSIHFSFLFKLSNEYLHQTFKYFLTQVQTFIIAVHSKIIYRVSVKYSTVLTESRRHYRFPRSNETKIIKRRSQTHTNEHPASDYLVITRRIGWGDILHPLMYPKCPSKSLPSAVLWGLVTGWTLGKRPPCRPPRI